MRPEDAFDGGADFHCAPKPLASSYGMHLCLRKPAGVRGHAPPHGSSRLLALSYGETVTSTAVSLAFVLELRYLWDALADVYGG